MAIKQVVVIVSLNACCGEQGNKCHKYTTPNA